MTWFLPNRPSFAIIHFFIAKYTYIVFKMYLTIKLQWWWSAPTPWHAHNCE